MKKEKTEDLVEEGGVNGGINPQEKNHEKLPLAMNGREDKEDGEDKSKEREREGFDVALELAGSWGIWQKRVFLIAHFSQVFCSIHAVSSAFLSFTPEHWCRVEGLEEVEENGTITPLEFKNLSIPWNSKDGYAKCEYYDYNYKVLFQNPDYYANTNVSTVTCDSWVFDQSVFMSTLVTEFNLVCGRRWMMATVQASFMSGLLIGSLIMGQLSDKFGRRNMCVACALCLCVVGTCASFVTTYAQFLALRFIIAFLCAGLMVVSFVIVLEVVKPSARALTGMLYAAFFGLGITILPGIAYLLRDWRHLEMAIGLSSSVLVAYYWVLPESPRWLASKNRCEEAIRILKVIARTNKKTLPPDIVLHKLVSSAHRKKPGCQNATKNIKRPCYMAIVGCVQKQLILLRTRVMRRRTLISFYLWFAAASVYYGLIFSGANIKADPFLMIFISGLVELPSAAVFIYVINRLGRRPTVSGLFTAIAVCLLAILAVPEEKIYVNFFLVNLGKFFTTAVFQLQWVYAVELFPTSVRNMAVGTCSMIARVGCVITPYIVTLLGDVHYVLPSTLFGILSLVAGLLTLLLPETNKTLLPETTDQVEAMPK